MTKELPITIRPAMEPDVPFIFNSWLKSYKNSLFAKPIDSTIYFAAHHKVLEDLMSQKNVIIACNSEDLNQIYGFLCYELKDGILVLHYLYIKHTFRNIGISKQLLADAGHDVEKATIYTHHTRIIERIAPKYNLVYHPYLAFKL